MLPTWGLPRVNTLFVCVHSCCIWVCRHLLQPWTLLLCSLLHFPSCYSITWANIKKKKLETIFFWTSPCQSVLMFLLQNVQTILFFVYKCMYKCGEICFCFLSIRKNVLVSLDWYLYFFFFCDASRSQEKSLEVVCGIWQLSLTSESTTFCKAICRWFSLHLKKKSWCENI